MVSIEGESVTPPVQVLLLACSFILCWTPYAVLALTSVVGVSQSVSPLVTILPHQLAKSSVLWDSLILIVHNPMVTHTDRAQQYYPPCYTSQFMFYMVTGKFKLN